MQIVLEIAYRGPDFKGWQSQAGGRGVQDAIEASLTKLCGEFIRIHGAGRTDTGVHALAQIAHFEAPEKARFAPDSWAVPINSYLPEGVRVLRSGAASAEFHSRFTATGKEYHFLLHTGPVFHPLMRGRAWHCPATLDIEVLREAWVSFLGRHNFDLYSVGRIPPPSSTFRTLTFLDMESQGTLHRLTVRGNGFLYRMVRCMAGAAVRVARGRATLAELREGLEGIASGSLPRHAAPAEGLYLARVFYPPEHLAWLQTEMETGLRERSEFLERGKAII